MKKWHIRVWGPETSAERKLTNVIIVCLLITVLINFIGILFYGNIFSIFGVFQFLVSALYFFIPFVIIYLFGTSIIIKNTGHKAIYLVVAIVLTIIFAYSIFLLTRPKYL